MKRLIIIFGLITICSVMHGQDNSLIYPKNIPDAEEKTVEILRASEAFVSVDWVGIDLEKIPAYEQFTLQFGERKLTIQKDRIEKRGINNFCFVGKNKEGVILVMSVLDKDIQGIIETSNGIYSIKTIGKDEYAIIKVDQSKMIEACANIHEDEHDDNNLEDINQTDSLDVGNIQSNAMFMLKANYDCRIRVLVLYTSAAQSSVSNINNTILSSIDDANQSFINSNINHRFELAYAGLTNYTESPKVGNKDGIDIDRDRFRDKNDGFIDEVHTLRDKYSADVCVLLVSRTDWCGSAYKIGASEENAFCVVDVLCAVSNHSFAHEIGHLLGCRHDTYMDNSNTPFAYGHGYINPNKTWRTIMAYPNDCNNCNRVQYWANPNIFYPNDGLVMGTVATNNTARVWNEQSNKIMGFRQPVNNVVISGSDISNSTIQADVIAKQTITTSGNVNIASNRTVTMQAGNSIILQSGFVASAGSVFIAKIENVSDCGLLRLTSVNGMEMSSEEATNLRAIADSLEEISNMQQTNEIDFVVFPNPNDGNFTVKIAGEVQPYTLEVFNSSGALLGYVNCNDEFVNINRIDLDAGIYFVKITMNGKIAVKKIIVR